MDVHEKRGNSRLHLAAEYTNTEMITHLVEECGLGDQLFVANASNHYPISVAARYSDAATVATLIRLMRMRNPEHNILYTVDRKGRSLLHRACITLNAERILPLITVLLDAGCNQVNHQDREGRTPLVMMAQRALFCANAVLLPIIDKLIHARSNVDATDKFDRTVLAMAAVAGNFDMVRLLLESGSSVHVRDVRGMSALDDVLSRWSGYGDKGPPGWHRCICALLQAGATTTKSGHVYVDSMGVGGRWSEGEIADARYTIYFEMSLVYRLLFPWAA